MSSKTPLVIGGLMLALVVYLMLIATAPDYIDQTQKLILYLIGIIFVAVMAVGVTR